MKTFVIGLTLAVAPVAANAAPIAFAPFDTSPLSDTALADVRGQGGIAALSVASMKRIVDDNGRADLRQTGIVGRVQMDVWWGSVGSELVAESVRAGAR